jgi:gamma-glutamyltranspeptidase/glutathione hydrolase
MQTTRALRIRVGKCGFVAFYAGMAIAALVGARPAAAAWPAPLRVPAGRGVVATDNVEASRAGAALLARGGNAVDAAVAAALALGVASPASSGLGGGGFLVVWSAKEQKAHVLDFRETAPAAATRDMFLVDGKAAPERSRAGGLAVAVPGEPAGLVEVERKFGKLGLRAAVAPAVRLASDGFVVSRFVAEMARLALAITPHPDEALARLLTPSGRPLAEGERVKRPELARTLSLLAERGADGFYKGSVAAAIAAAVRAQGGLVTVEDLARYRPAWRAPIEGHFRGHTIYAPPPPSGGPTLVETLQILDARPRDGAGAGASSSLHAMAEALKHAFADRARLLGDPDFVSVPTARLVDPTYARALATRISDGAVQPADAYGDKTLGGAPAAPPRDKGTSHLCVVDGEGNAVALTTTVNLPFGARLVAGETGVLLNDEMDDFSAQPGVPNAFGLVGAEANAIAPGKRPLSSMSPSLLVKDGRVVLCAGASGGPAIVSATAQAIVDVIDFGLDAESAAGWPRVHAQWMPELVFVEREVPADVVDGLRRRGQKVKPAPVTSSAVQLVVARPDGGLEAASDPRKGGAPAAP